MAAACSQAEATRQNRKEPYTTHGSASISYFPQPKQPANSLIEGYSLPSRLVLAVYVVVAGTEIAFFIPAFSPWGDNEG